MNRPAEFIVFAQTPMAAHEKPGMDVVEGEGVNICVEAMQELKEVEGVRGFHVMAIEWEQIVPEIVERTGGLYPRPQISGEGGANAA